MSKRTLLISCVLFFFAGYSVKSFTKTEPGQEPYVPTRVEWLVLDLEASSRQSYSAGVGIDYVVKAPNTVGVLVQYTDNASAAAVDSAAKHAQELVQKYATNYGWSSWVKVEVLRHNIRE